MSTKTKSAQVVDIDDAREFLQLLDPDAKEFDFRTIGPEWAPRGERRAVDNLRGRLRDVRPALEQANRDGCGVYVTVNETDGGGVKAANITRVRALFADLDDGLPAEWPVDPNFIVNTSPDKFQAYWLISNKDEVTRDQFAACMRGIAARWRSASEAKDLARVLRVPGFWHQKDQANPYRVRFELLPDSVKPYRVEKLVAAFAIEQEAEEPRSESKPARTWTDADIESMLRVLPASFWDPRDNWRDVGMALHDHYAGSTTGFNLWSRYCRASSKYDPADNEGTWASFKGTGITIGTLVALGKANGWQGTPLTAADDNLRREVERLSSLAPDRYDGERKPIAEAYGVRVGTLDKMVAAERDKQADAVAVAPSAGALYTREQPPWDSPVDGDELLAKLCDTIDRHIVMPESTVMAVALWIVHAHCLEAARHNPFLHIHSPVKGCGKSTLLELLSTLVPRPMVSGSTTAAVVFRAIEKYHPTLLVDEVETFLRGREELRGIFDVAHKRELAYVMRCVGEGLDLDVKQFSVWAPIALTGIGRLHATIEDRSLSIQLQRKSKRNVEQLPIERDAYLPLHRKCVRWAADNIEELRRARPSVPELLRNRARDNWLPLLAIADAAGGEWPELARGVATRMTARAMRDDEDVGILLLKDLKDIFDREGDAALASKYLCAQLVEVEHRPWGEYSAGKNITVHKLAKMLLAFGVKPIRMSGRGGGRGYQYEALDRVWVKYIT